MCGNGQLMGAMGLALSTVPQCRRGTILVRCLKFGANTPRNPVRFSRGLALMGSDPISDQTLGKTPYQKQSEFVILR